MALRPVYADADSLGPIVEGLIRRGWDVMRAVDAEREATDDSVHFERAARLGRVLQLMRSSHRIERRGQLEHLARAAADGIVKLHGDLVRPAGLRAGRPPMSISGCSTV